MSLDDYNTKKVETEAPKITVSVCDHHSIYQSLLNGTPLSMKWGTNTMNITCPKCTHTAYLPSQRELNTFYIIGDNKLQVKVDDDYNIIKVNKWQTEDTKPKEEHDTKEEEDEHPDGQDNDGEQTQ